MTVIALRAPDISVTVVDLNAARIAAWNSAELPVFEPGLLAAVQACRGKNLFFTTQAEVAIAAADIVFVAVNTPAKSYGLGAGRAADLGHVESVARLIAGVAATPKIIVEKSTIPVRAAETITAILAGSGRPLAHQVLSNPAFMAEGTALADLLAPDRVLIGGDTAAGGRQAVQTLVDVYARWVPRERIITMNLWSAELSKLAANALLAQRISSINAISALCEATGADVDEVADAIGRDSRIGPKFLQASAGFGGACFQRDIYTLAYLCEHHQLPVAAGYWEAVIDLNDWQKDRFAARIVRALFNTITDKRIAVLGFAFKKDTNDARESPAITIVRDLLAEKAHVVVYDPQVSEAQILHEVLGTGAGSPRLSVAVSAERAAAGAHALVIMTEWEEFRTLDFAQLFSAMPKPAFIFDGRNMLPLDQLRAIGFHAYAIGKPGFEHVGASKPPLLPAAAAWSEISPAA
jgi:UDPglucose 6-dehydrogenase